MACLDLQNYGRAAMCCWVMGLRSYGVMELWGYGVKELRGYAVTL